MVKNHSLWRLKKAFESNNFNSVLTKITFSLSGSPSTESLNLLTNIFKLLWETFAPQFCSKTFAQQECIQRLWIHTFIQTKVQKNNTDSIMNRYNIKML